MGTVRDPKTNREYSIRAFPDGYQIVCALRYPGATAQPSLAPAPTPLDRYPTKQAAEDALADLAAEKDLEVVADKVSEVEIG